MTDDLEFDPALLARYFTGACTRAEARAFEQWVAARPEREAFVAQLRQVWQMDAAGTGAPVDAEAAWQKITSQLTDYRGEPMRPPLRLERGSRTRPPRVLMHPPASMLTRVIRRVAVAAGLLLAVGGGAWLTLRHHAGAPTDYTMYTTQHGRRTVRLADGSRVTLGPLSRLRVSVGDARRDRRVELEGQAFFQVAHDPSRPFRVRARQAETRVLGTEFLVRAYADERDVRVAVRSGRVAVRGGATTRSAAEAPAPVLTAGQRANVSPDGVVRLDRVPDASAFAWVAGPLRFESTPFGEVAHEVSRWVGLDLAVPDSALSATKVTAAFPDLSRDSVLARLVRLSGARPVRVRDDVVVLIDTNSLRRR